MTFHYFIKVFISSAIIVLVSEIAKRDNLLGGLVASIPIVSVLSMIWLYIESKDIEKIKNLSNSIFWMVIPSLIFLYMIRNKLKLND